MAITIPIVTEFRDAGLKKAEREVQGFSNKIGDKLKNLSTTQLAAAGAAVAAFAWKAVDAFQDLALEAGKFSDATGIAVEDASRWLEVAGDLGIEGSKVEGALMRMNKVIGEGSPIFDQLGISISRTAEGTVDANKTFQAAITTIGGIEDPTLRAKAAQEVFGRSYGEIAELMELSAGDLATALSEVSDAKVIDQEELNQARKFRAAMDGLRDSLEDVQIEIGMALVPALSDLARGLQEVQVAGIGVGDYLTTAFDMLLDRVGLGGVRDLGAFQNAFDEMKESARLGGLTLEEAAGYADYYSSRVAAARNPTRDLEQAVGGLEGAVARLQGRLSLKEAWRNFDEARWTFHSNLSKTEEQTDDFTSALADMVTSLQDVPEITQVQLITLLEQGQIDRVERWLNQWRMGINVPIRTIPTGAGGGVPKREWGGPVTAHRAYIVGERGPELFIPNASGNITSNGRMEQSISQAPVNVTINTSADPNEVVRAIELYRRRNGTDRI